MRARNADLEKQVADLEEELQGQTRVIETQRATIQEFKKKIEDLCTEKENGHSLAVFLGKNCDVFHELSRRLRNPEDPDGEPGDNDASEEEDEDGEDGGKEEEDSEEEGQEGEGEEEEGSEEEEESAVPDSEDGGSGDDQSGEDHEATGPAHVSEKEDGQSENALRVGIRVSALDGIGDAADQYAYFDPTVQKKIPTKDTRGRPPGNFPQGKFQRNGVIRFAPAGKGPRKFTSQPPSGALPTQPLLEKNKWLESLWILIVNTFKNGGIAHAVKNLGADAVVEELNGLSEKDDGYSSLRRHLVTLGEEAKDAGGSGDEESAASDVYSFTGTSAENAGFFSARNPAFLERNKDGVYGIGNGKNFLSVNKWVQGKVSPATYSKKPSATFFARSMSKIYEFLDMSAAEGSQLREMHTAWQAFVQVATDKPEGSKLTYLDAWVEEHGDINQRMKNATYQELISFFEEVGDTAAPTRAPKKKRKNRGPPKGQGQALKKQNITK